MAGEDDFFKLLGRIEVDNDALKKSLGDSENLVRQSGERLKRIWEQGVTPERVAGSEDIRLRGQSLQIGGRNVPTGASVFSKEGQQAIQAAKLAEAAQKANEDHARAAREASTASEKYNISVRDAAGSVRLLGVSILSELNPALGQAASVALNSARNMRDLGVGVAALGGAAALAAVAIGFYISKVKEGVDAQVALGAAIQRSDFGALEGQIKSAGQAIAEFEQLQQIAARQTKKRGLFQGGGDPEEFKKQTESIIAYWQNAGKSLETLKKRLDDATAASALLFKTFEVPKLNLQAIVEAEATMQKKLGLDKERVKTGGELRAIVEGETASIRKQTDARVALINEEAKQIRLQQGNREISPEVAAKKLEEIERRKSKARADGAIEEETALRKGLAAAAQIDAAKEQYFQKDIQRDQDRYASAAATAERIAQSENTVAEIRRKQFSIAESSEALEKRLAATREATIGPLVSNIDAINAKYASQKRALQDLIDANAAGSDADEKMADLEKSRVEEVGQARRRVAEETAAFEAKAAQARELRNQAEIESEKRLLDHRVAMGRASYAEAIRFQSLAAVDPRRGLDQQREAEQKAFALKKAYAEDYFRLYTALGQNTWDQQLKFAENVLSQTVTGSKAWFDAVQKVSDVYKQIHDQAKGLFATQAGIAEQEARRQGRTRIRAQDIGMYFNMARQRAQRTLTGGQAVEFGDITSALNVMEAGRQTTQMGLQPGQALALAMRDPAQDLAETIGRVSTSIETVSATSKEGNEAMANLGSSASGAADALREMTEAAKQAADALRGTQGQRSSESPSGQQTERKTQVLETNGGRSYTNIPPVVSSGLGRLSLLESRRGVAGAADV